MTAVDYTAVRVGRGGSLGHRLERGGGGDGFGMAPEAVGPQPVFGHEQLEGAVGFGVACGLGSGRERGSCERVRRGGGGQRCGAVGGRAGREDGFGLDGVLVGLPSIRQ